ncbi:hypothetical protein L6R50_17420 [Myxococcota bacterium]|nr:hypothetical protein [Myxococcota bacterium]
MLPSIEDPWEPPALPRIATVGAPPEAIPWLAEALGEEGLVDALEGDGLARLDASRHAAAVVWQGPDGADGAAVARSLRREPWLRWMAVIGVARRAEPKTCVDLLEALVDDVVWDDDPPVLLRTRIRNLLTARETESRIGEMTREHSLRLEANERALETAETELLALREIASLARLSDRMSHELRGRVSVVAASSASLTAQLRRLGPLVEGTVAELGRGRVEDYVRLLAEVLEAEVAPYRPEEAGRRGAEARRWLAAWSSHRLEGEGAEGDDDVALARELAAARIDDALRDRVATYRAAGRDSLTLLLLGASARAAGERLAEVVDAMRVAVEQLRSFSLGVGPVPGLDIHEGLELTLSLMAYDLAPHLSVRRAFQSAIPRVRANPAELNAVWTNLIQEACSCAAGHAILEVRTRRDAIGGKAAARVDVILRPAGGGAGSDAEDVTRRLTHRVCVDLLARWGGQLRSERSGDAALWTVVIPAQED